MDEGRKVISMLVMIRVSGVLSVRTWTSVLTCLMAL